MNGLTRTLLTLLLLPASAAATTHEFEWKNPVPQGNGLFAMDFEDDLIGYAVGSKGTSLKTSDGGQTWIDQTRFPEFDRDLLDVRVHGPEDLIAVGESPGIYRSLDGGQSWTAVANPSTGTLRNIEAISGDTLSVVGDSGQILRSSDGGVNWSFLPSPENRKIHDQFWWNSQAGYVVGEQITRQTTDGGQSWSPLPGVPEPRVYTKVHFLDPLNGWLLQHFNTYRTTDGGASWFEKHGGITNSPLYQEEVVFVDASRRFVVTFLEGAQIWETVDDGESWELLHLRNLTVGYTDIERLGDGSLIVCSSYGDLLRSVDLGETWTNFTTSPGDFERGVLQAMQVRPGARGFAGGSAGVWLTTTDGGESWEIPAVSPDITIAYAIAMRSDDFVLASGYTPGEPSTVFRTLDGGASWTAHALTGTYVGYPQDIEIVSTSTSFAATYGGGVNNHVFRSLDNGQTWAEVAQEIGASERLVSLHFVDADTGFVAGAKTGGNALLWKTVDGGDSWTEVSAAAVGPQISDMHWMDADTGFVVNTGGLFHTSDGGGSWTHVLADPACGLDFRDSLRGALVNCYDDHMWVTSDGGLTWLGVDYSWEFPAQNVAVTTDGFLLCGQGSTILRGRETDPTWVPDDTPTGKDRSRLDLSIVPNPFDSTTNIHFTMPAAGPARLAVYDFGGRRIVLLESEYYPGGAFELSWDGRDEDGRPLGSGVYFVRLEGADFSVSARVTLLR